MFVCCECCVLSSRGLCDGLITRPEESYRLWRVVVCDQETSKTRRLKPAVGLWKYNSGLYRQENKQTNNKNSCLNYPACNSLLSVQYCMVICGRHEFWSVIIYPERTDGQMVVFYT
jgi:hypothetical protein